MRIIINLHRSSIVKSYHEPFGKSPPHHGGRQHRVGGTLSYGICQTGCNAVAVACYASAGAVFGTVTAGAGIPAAIVGCNSALGVCMVSCIAAGCSPIP